MTQLAEDAPRDSSGAGAAGGSGSIYDLGYRRYDGPRLGRPYAIWSLVSHSIRTAWGLGRSTRSKVWPVGLAVFATLPSLLALGIVMLVTQIGEAGEAIEAISPIRYATIFPITAILVFLFAAGQAPELFGRDQRAGVLPLYFSRAVTRIDYASARALGLLASLLVLVLVPQLILFAGRILVAIDPVDGFAAEVPSLPAVLLMGVAMASVVGLAASAIAALTPRRSYATAGIIALFIVPSFVAQILAELAGDTLLQVAVMLSPGDVLDGLNAFLFSTLPDSDAVRAADLDGWVYVAIALAWIGVALAILFRRYQRLVT